MRWLDLLARCWPRAVTADSELDHALDLLDADTDARTLVRASYGAALWLVVGGGLLSAAAGPLALGIGCLVAVCVVLGVPALPELAATARRNAALATAPDLVSYAVLRASLEPNAEAAAAFAADVGTGPLAASLDAHVRQARGRAVSGFEAFAGEWDDWLPALGRAFALVETATAAPPEERERVLERAQRTVRDGVRERTAAFASGLRGPATAVYAFGVLLPLALVAGLPAARATGLPLSLAAIAVGYCLVLPAGLLAASAWLLARRPAAFPRPRIDRSHPDVPTERWRPVLAGALAGTGGWLLAALLLPAWTRPVAAAGAGSGVALLVWAEPRVAVHERVRAVEAGVPDALALVGRRVSDGTPVEAAMADVGDELAGETGAVFADAVERQRRLGVGVRASLLDTTGALATLPSQRARSVAIMLSVGADEGAPAGGALAAMATHLDDLQRLEGELRRELRRVTGTLANTASVFGPLVAGAAVALAAGIGSRASGTPLPTAGLGLVMGTYALVLSAVLAALATGLEAGIVPARMGRRAGRALLSATATYLAAFVGAGALT
ncbi:MAG: type II secretion system protein [Haloferacaceae archaeon]